MSTGRITNRLLLTLGGSLVVGGLVLGHFPSPTAMSGFVLPASAALILIGIGLCILLFVTVRWLISPVITFDAAGIPVEGTATEVGNDWRQRAKQAVIISTVAAVISPTLFVGGFFWALLGLICGPDWEIRSEVGGPEFVDLWLILMAAGLFIGLIGMFCYPFGIIAGWFAWKTSGSRSWFITALILPVLPVLIFATVWSKL